MSSACDERLSWGYSCEAKFVAVEGFPAISMIPSKFLAALGLNAVGANVSAEFDASLLLWSCLEESVKHGVERRWLEPRVVDGTLGKSPRVLESDEEEDSLVGQPSR